LGRGSLATQMSVSSCSKRLTGLASKEIRWCSREQSSAWPRRIADGYGDCAFRHIVCATRSCEDSTEHRSSNISTQSKAPSLGACMSSLKVLVAVAKLSSEQVNNSSLGNNNRDTSYSRRMSGPKCSNNKTSCHCRLTFLAAAQIREGSCNMINYHFPLRKLPVRSFPILLLIITRNYFLLQTV
jgi:hypothetical protein